MRVMAKSASLPRRLLLLEAAPGGAAMRTVTLYWAWLALAAREAARKDQRLVAVGQGLLEGGEQLFVLLGEGQLGNVDIYPPIPECEVIVYIAHAGRRIGDFYELVFFLYPDGRFVNERILIGLGPVVVEHVCVLRSRSTWLLDK